MCGVGGSGPDLAPAAPSRPRPAFRTAARTAASHTAGPARTPASPCAAEHGPRGGSVRAVRTPGEAARCGTHREPPSRPGAYRDLSGADDAGEAGTAGTAPVPAAGGRTEARP
ncbi:hypothetical protein VT52_011965 [Streptomyces malaysiense]|uniref:Uncharacterized protein n=1 Tax=Streptomyces malaysiense TaxID=1428626 RepID=A0A1J4Q4K0_9ACTN|nr:hypothetical protein VT52_011965 [Streptomyces malaysiense]